jgi:3'-phosphoadenosine 5'-phosphosulfate sulfotransferase (PAPS reductase)/FAD synthetase
MDKINVLSFSGGKDSTATLIHLIKVLGIVPIVVFCDTGNESKITHDYIDYVSELLKSWGGLPAY